MAKDETKKDIRLLIKPKIKITFSQVVCILISAFFFIYPVVLDAFTTQVSNERIETYTQQVMMQDEEIPRLLAEADAYNKRLALEPYDYEGKIPPENMLISEDPDLPFAWVELQSLGQKIPIYHGTGYEALQAGVGHLEETSIPIGGPSTHAVLTGHSGMRGSRMFDDIDKIQEGEIILVHILDQTLAYRVYGHDIVLPNDSSTIKIEKGRDLLSLITCYPYGINTHRYILHAERVPLDDVDDDPSPLGAFLNQRTLPMFGALAAVILLLLIWWVRRPREIGHSDRRLKRLRRHHRLPDPDLIEWGSTRAWNFYDPDMPYSCCVYEFDPRKIGIIEETEWVHHDNPRKSNLRPVIVAGLGLDDPVCDEDGILDFRSFDARR